MSPLQTNPGANPNTIYIGFGEQNLTLNTTITGATGYLWSPATGLSCTDCLAPVASPTTTTPYTLTTTGANNCTTTRTTIIYVVNVEELCPG